MRYFDYSFLETGMLPAGLVNVVATIAELREREAARKQGNKAIFTRLESIAKVQSVKDRTRLRAL
jgi:hypothetical protein